MTLFAFSCKQPKVDEHKAETTVIIKKINQDSLQHQLDESIHFIGDSLLKNKGALLKNYLKKYQTDTCAIIAYSDKDLKEGFEGLKKIGDINGDKIADTVL